MSVLSTEGSERKTDRAEAFTDAVLAIAITLPIVDLKAPDAATGASLAARYAELYPHYIAYALSFSVIGLYWGYSHFGGKLLRKTDHGFNLLTLLFLGAVSLTPFPTLPFVEHFDDPANIRTAASVYALMLTLPAVLWTVRWLYGVRRGLLNPHLAPDYVSRVSRRYVAHAAVCVAGTLVTTWVDWRIGIALVGLTTALYLLPPTAPVFRPGEEPRDDIQEADEEREI